MIKTQVFALKIKSLNIKNFKSIVDITINEPNPFTVFVGPNGSGKSNIFEALEFANFAKNDNVEDIFGGRKAFLNFNHLSSLEDSFGINYLFLFKDSDFKRRTWWINDEFKTDREPTRVSTRRIGFEESGKMFDEVRNVHLKQLDNFHRIFVGKSEIEKQKITSENYLSLAASNLEKVLKRLLENKIVKEEIIEWLELFIPEFQNIEVRKSEFSSNEDLLIYQKHYEKPFNKELISDGTYNILCLLTAVFQSDEPQFLCIEEPENGLNPKVIKEFVNFFRDACEQKGHYIWINTHSQTLVSQLKEEEMIIVDKINGETKIKQFKQGAFYGMPADEALLTNALGGGIPW